MTNPFFSFIAFILLGPAFLTGTCLAQSNRDTLTKDKAVQIAMENSLLRRMAGQDIQIADETLSQAVSAFGPTLTLEAGIFRYDDQPSMVQLNQGLVRLSNALSGQNQEMPSDSRTYYGGGLKVTQPLYTGRKLTATRRLALANLESAKKDMTTSDNDLALAAKKAYYTVILARQMSKALDEAVESMNHHAEEAKAYHDLKIVPKLDLLRAEEKLADLQQQQLYAHNNVALAMTALNYVLGVDMDTKFSFDDDPGCPPLKDHLEACITTALDLRPELGAMDAKIKMAEEQILIAKSDWLPTFALVGEAHKYEPENEDPAAQIGIVASVDLYDNGQVKHKVSRARIQLEKAKTAKKQMTRGIRLQVEKAFHNAQVSWKSIDVAKRSLDTAQEALDVARTRYRVGLSTSLERLDAEVSLTQAKTNHIHAASMYNIAISELERAMGKE